MTDFYRCSICGMYHKIGFDPKRDAAKVSEEHPLLGRRLVEPPDQFVWRHPPPGARVVREPHEQG